MSTADQLLPLIFSWIEKREQCADKLIQLARELQSLRKKCNAGECVGSSTAVVGAACLIGAGVATLFTAGAAAPFLGMLGATFTGIGITVSVGAKITESFLSSDTMKEAKEVEEGSNKTASEIQQLFDKLRAEAKAQYPSADPDELDEHITTEILTSMAKRSGLKGRVSIRLFNGKPEIFLNGRPRRSGIDDIFASSALFGVAGVLSFFTFQLSGKEFQLLFAEGVTRLVKQMSTTAFKSALKGGAKVVGGAVGMVFALHEAIDNWTDLIKKNYVTEASQSLRDTADSIRKATKALREQMDSIKETLDEMAKCQQEQEEEEKKKKAEEEQKEKEKNRKAEVLFAMTLQSNSSAYHSHGYTETQHCHTDKNYQETGRSDKPGGQQPGRGNGGGTGGDTGGQRSDSDEEDGDSDEEDSDSDEEDSDSDEEDSDSDEEDSYSDDSSDSTYQSSISQHQSSSSDFTSDSTCQLRVSKGVDCEKIHQKMVSEPSVPWCNMGHLNIRSINNKQFRISNLIIKFMLDVLTLTETWVTVENGDQRLREILPDEFQFHHQPRESVEGESTRGGGVANVFSNELQGERVQFENMSFQSFQYVITDLHHDGWNRPIRMTTVYRRPGGNNQDMEKFLEEFQKLLNMFSEDDCILITGDFNIKVNDKNDKHAKRFKERLEDNGLTQHVKEETHQKHNTLDLVITRNVDISNLRVKKPKTKIKTKINKKTKKRTKKNKTISDHYAVLFSARPTPEKKEDKKHTDPTDPPSKQFKDREE